MKKNKEETHIDKVIRERSSSKEQDDDYKDLEKIEISFNPCSRHNSK
jgi:hypothetical protein